jgi:hypothetical protein
MQPLVVPGIIGYDLSECLPFDIVRHFSKSMHQEAKGFSRDNGMTSIRRHFS